MKELKHHLDNIRQSISALDDILNNVKYRVDFLIDHIADLEDKMKEREVQNDNRSI